jgi:hypothetical protein
MATVKDLQSLSIPFLAILAARTALHRLREVGRSRLINTRGESRPSVVDIGPHSVQRQTHSQALETAYIHTDNSIYGWGAVLNEHLEDRGL